MAGLAEIEAQCLGHNLHSRLGIKGLNQKKEVGGKPS